MKPLAFQRDDADVHKALMQAANDYLAAHRDHRFADAGMIVKLGLLVLAGAGFYGMSLQQSTGWGYFGYYLGFIFTAMLITVNVVHDASHNAFFKRRWANRWLNVMVSIPLGLDPDCWRVRHVIFHHGHNNVEGYDLDIEPNGVLRQTPFQRWKPFMRVQRFYWPLVAAMTFPYYIWLFDWLDRAGQTPVTRRMAQHGVRGWGLFVLGKGLHLTLALLIPLWVLPPTLSALDIVLVYLVSQMLSSLLFVMLIIGTHWAKAKFYRAPYSGELPHGRYHHVFATTIDWQTTPRWLGYWVGGANLHLTHHLFPHWSHRHYPALSQIISEVAPRFGLAYQRIGPREMLRLQQRFLSAMGANKAPDA
ncbi:linoleoyl-CoA desaturase [Pseudomonas sp. ok272]|uniref:fatty acid desaturase family protein n=1 Tax=unclassified Pseudomonas TaxID=196821 RepID=UPI0008CA9C84|nr:MULTISPECIES: acyl-CoA desaturase [unclassified Pseudomonas]SEM48818.1 linoleoyl-CoA desaturase [Pseudomonas sp. ok272]SFM20384.1 linoleoyl-CoA desaturase [Pseudomonas sp. ok602]